MIVEKTNGRNVLIRARDKNGKRYEKTISGYWPYCYMEDENVPYAAEAVRTEAGYTGLYGESLTKVYCATPYDVRQLSHAGSTWEANIPYTNKVLCDYINDGNDPIPNYKHRTWYLDCEWSPTTGHMRVIVAYDNFTGKEYVWFVEATLAGQGLKDGEGVPYSELGEYEYETPAMGFPSERSMLIHFMRILKNCDPDIITGWYVVGADIKQIVERTRACGLPSYGLSPLRRLRYEYGDWEQPIVGRNCIDLMLAVSKLWDM